MSQPINRRTALTLLAATAASPIIPAASQAPKKAPRLVSASITGNGYVTLALAL